MIFPLLERLSINLPPVFFFKSLMVSIASFGLGRGKDQGLLQGRAGERG